MSDQNETTTEESAQDRNWRQMRERLDTLEGENKTLKTQLRGTAFRDAGFDPDKGLGKALAKLYDGPMDAEAIQRFAADEYGWESDAAPSGNSGVREAIEGSQRALDQVNASVMPSQPQDRETKRQTRIRELEQKGGVPSEEEFALLLAHQGLDVTGAF